MANRPIWNIRQRHEWLTAKNLKHKRLKRRKRARVGLQDALERKQPGEPHREAHEG